MGAGKGKLAGDLLRGLMLAGEPLPPRARNGGTDPQSLAEFLTTEIPFRTEPAIGVVLPSEAHDAE